MLALVLMDHALVLMDHAMRHRAQNLDVHTGTPIIPGAVPRDPAD